ncbi:RpiB/LacA/LacB family sugar-phosphate isomerase [Candidatus Woesearchaeota archaeon]|nr:RpiB/LacA/LacB family sugar-phosphate isomerase [Candidatus Woesearchaeota archaeon]
MIVIGSDHGGFELKKKIKDQLDELGEEYEDIGCYSGESCDYPEFSARIGKDVKEHPDWKGILVCRSGIGMAMVANKFKGVRAAVCRSVKEAKAAREHNDANVLAIGADYTEEDEIPKIVETFLATPFSKEERHRRRVKQMNKLGE